MAYCNEFTSFLLRIVKLTYLPLNSLITYCFFCFKHCDVLVVFCVTSGRLFILLQLVN